MTVTMTMRVRSNDFPQIIATLPERADQIVAKAALDIEAHAKSIAPVDTGTLRASIQAIKIGLAHWKVVVSVHYAAYVEFGTVKMAAQPFLQPAVNFVRPVLIQALRKVVRP